MGRGVNKRRRKRENRKKERKEKKGKKRKKERSKKERKKETDTGGQTDRYIHTIDRQTDRYIYIYVSVVYIYTQPRKFPTLESEATS